MDFKEKDSHLAMHEELERLGNLTGPQLQIAVDHILMSGWEKLGSPNHSLLFKLSAIEYLEQADRLPRVATLVAGREFAYCIRQSDSAEMQYYIDRSLECTPPADREKVGRFISLCRMFNNPPENIDAKNEIERFANYIANLPADTMRLPFIQLLSNSTIMNKCAAENPDLVDGLAYRLYGALPVSERPPHLNLMGGLQGDIIYIHTVALAGHYTTFLRSDRGVMDGPAKDLAARWNEQCSQIVDREALARELRSTAFRLGDQERTPLPDESEDAVPEERKGMRATLLSAAQMFAPSHPSFSGGGK